MLAALNANHALGLLSGALSSFFWTLTYVLIIRQGWRDRTFGMPLAALGANLSWEVIFLCDTLAISAYDARLAMILPWTLLESAIVVQCFRYGRRDFRHPLVVRYFPLGLAGIIGLAACLELAFIREFHDAIGWYAAFAQNFMMSVLFVAMLLRRDHLGGQSLAIAVSKLLGTLFAFLLALCWSPPSLHEHWAALLPSRYTPVAPLIVVLYGATLAFDLLYIALIVWKRRPTPR